MNCLSFNPYSEYILATGSADKVNMIIYNQIYNIQSVSQVVEIELLVEHLYHYFLDCGLMGSTKSEVKASFI